MSRFRRRQVDTDYEKNIITGLILGSEFCEHILPIIESNPELTSLSYAKPVVSWVSGYYRNYKKAPGKQIQKIYEKEKRGLEDEIADLISIHLSYLSNEYGKAGDDYDASYFIDDVRDYLRKKEVVNHVTSIQKLLKKGKHDEAILQLTKGFTSKISFNNTHETGFTAKELQEMEIPAIKWLIEGVIPKGLTLFAGKPKTGKSYFVLNAAIDTALGEEAFGSIPTERGRVLYLALEDSRIRLKDRLNKILSDDNWPDNLHIYTMGSWPKLYQGGLQELEKWMKDHPDTNLIIIDTLEKIKKPQKSSGYFYSDDHRALAPLQEFAGKHNTALIVIHHTKKTSTKDVFDEISGTTGLTAAADTLAVMSRVDTGRAGRVFALRGRDIGEQELAFRFKDFRWILMGDAWEYQTSESRQAIINFLKNADSPVRRGDIVKALEGRETGKGIDVLLRKLVFNGDIEKVDYGKYASTGYGESERSKKISERQRQKLNEKRKRRTASA